MDERLEKWMDGYVAAWDSNDPDLVADLFTADAHYDPQTAEGPWEGRAAIVEAWLQIDDTPGNWEFEWRPLVETGDTSVIVGRTRYIDPPTSYRNLFVIQFADDGRCREFTEWWIDEEPEDDDAGPMWQ